MQFLCRVKKYESPHEKQVCACDKSTQKSINEWKTVLTGEPFCPACTNTVIRRARLIE